MLLTKTQKKILEIVREYGGMRADMLNSLCPEAYSFEVSLHQLEVNRKLIKTGEYYCDDTLLICDMPFMSYQASVYDAVVNAGRLMKEGRAHAVKLEGGVEMEETIRAIVNASIPVCGHIGLTPQSINAFGGFKVQGKGEAAAQKLLDDARAVERAGAFAIVLECVPAALAKRVTEEISIPTIGIGAGADCDGQVLVYQDMLGMFTDFKPKFVKHFANVGQIMTEAFKAYDAEVKAGEFPAAEHTYKIDDSIIEKLY